MDTLKNTNKKDNYLKLIHNKIYKKYNNNKHLNYNTIVINNLLSNSKCHIVAIFKDFLLYDEYAEFLKRFYKYHEIVPRLIKIYKYYNKTSFLYPNYSPLVESKYIYYNIIKKQIIINKMANYKKRNLKKNIDIKKEEDIKKDEKDFFSNTIYNDILNESKSFMSLLFGEEGKKNGKKNTEKIENEKEIEDFKKIIDTIQKTEIKKKKFSDLFLKNNIKKKINYKKPDIADIKVYNNTKYKKNNIYYINNNINNNSNSLFVKSTNNSTASPKNSVINTIQNQKFLFEKFKKNKVVKNNRGSYKKEKENDNIYKKVFLNNNNSNYNNTNANISNDKLKEKIVYHRKVKSNLIGNYLNKLDLPSNLNVVNSLKIANEAIGNSQKKNCIKVTLFKNNNKNKKINKSNNDIKDLKNSITRIIKLPKQAAKNISTEGNIKNNKTQMLKTPKAKLKENILIKLTKIKNNSTKIEIPFITKKPLYYITKKRKSPIYIRNNFKAITFNNSNGEIEPSLNTNTVLNSYRKPDRGLKSLYINPNITGPYSKPKGLNKEKKYIGISSKKLFDNSDLYLSPIKAKKVNNNILSKQTKIK